MITAAVRRSWRVDVWLIDVVWRGKRSARTWALAAFTLFATSLGSIFSPILALNLLTYTTRDFLRALGSVNHLPLSRRRLFAHSAAWTLLWTLVSFGAGLRLHYGYFAAAPWPAQIVDLDVRLERAADEDGFTRVPQVKVPRFRWKISRGLPSPIRAPWGEEVVPRAYPIFWKLPIHVYNPYELSPSSSLRFVAWQLSRALHDVYDAQISPEEIEPHLRKSPWPGKPATWRSRNLLVLHPELEMVEPRHAMSATFLLCLFLWGLAMLSSVPSRPPASRPAWKRRRLKLAFWIVVLLALVLAIGAGIRENRGQADAVVDVAFRLLAEALPAQDLVCWMLVTAIGAAIYLVAERGFLDMEELRYLNRRGHTGR